MNQPSFNGFTAAELADCARRELSQRDRVYKRLVVESKMRSKDAEREIALMTAIAEHFEAVVNPKLF